MCAKCWAPNSTSSLTAPQAAGRGVGGLRDSEGPALSCLRVSKAADRQQPLAPSASSLKVQFKLGALFSACETRRQVGRCWKQLLVWAAPGRRAEVPRLTRPQSPRFRVLGPCLGRPGVATSVPTAIRPTSQAWRPSSRHRHPLKMKDLARTGVDVRDHSAYFLCGGMGKAFPRVDALQAPSARVLRAPDPPPLPPPPFPLVPSWPPGTTPRVRLSQRAGASLLPLRRLTGFALALIISSLAASVRSTAVLYWPCRAGVCSPEGPRTS